jgi:SNF2 family DNA or RNA helicase
MLAAQEQTPWFWPVATPGELAVLSVPCAQSQPAPIKSWPALALTQTEPVSWSIAPLDLTFDSWSESAPQLNVQSFTFRVANKPVLISSENNVCELPVSLTTELLPTTETGSASVVQNTPELPIIPEKYTRLDPPAGLVKLEDRLFYLLQPALETLLIEQDLHFPFHPFPYQMQGIAFLFPRANAMLADEMGLGKTMQAITSMRLLIHAGDAQQILLVCPKPLVSNWVREFNLWAPELPIAVIEGDSAKRQWQWDHVDVPIKIANYESLCRDKDLVCEGAKHFDLVVLDESQRIKNRSSTTAQVVRSIQRTRSWALTGTPVENSPDDLHGIFEFVAPGQLRKGMKPQAMGKAVSEFILRRKKEDVLTEMPPKLFRDASIDLNPAQANSYRRAEDEGILELSDMGESATIQHVFELVLRLKQICNFDPATQTSAKLERLEADLEEIAASGQKAILFSQWVDTLDKLSHRLKRFGVMQYHGGIPHRERETVIQQFKEDPSKHLILMSYGAGSVGLNLQFCQYVFLFDRWWNPAVEDQAINRAHRIGVAGPVTVTRFVTNNTIEERINQVLEEKRAMFAAILDNAEANESWGLSANEIFGLFKLKCPNGPIKYAA